MTSVLLTIDTEPSPAAFQRGESAADNFLRAILGKVPDGEWGIRFQAQLLAAHGLKAVFFVETLCAGVLGLDIVKRTIEPILSYGHTAQLHVHTEWLKWSERDPVDGQRGACMADFNLEHQCRLIALGTEYLIAAGAPAPVAFRAGNYGANNDTLRALARLGIKFDTSYNFPYLGNLCRITTDGPLLDPVALEGVVEVPIAFFEDYPGHQRPAQICATSASELRLVLSQSIAQNRRATVIVGHSFELLNAARARGNRFLVRRFERLCEFLGEHRALAVTQDFSELDMDALTDRTANVVSLQSNPARTALRMIQQAAGLVLYG